MLRMTRHFTSWAMLVALISAVCGCSEDPPPPVITQKTKPKKKKRTRASIEKRKKEKAAEEAAAAAKKKEEDFIANAEQKNRFETADMVPNFEIAEPVSKVKPEDRFEFSSPQDNQNSANFEVVSVGTDKDALTGQQNSNFRMLPGFRIADGATYSSNGLPSKIVCEKDNSTMVLVTAGPFVFGTDNGSDDSGPPTKIDLDPFYMDVLEVTGQQYDLYRADMKAKNKRIPFKPLNSTASADQPALGVTWGEARAFARWLGKDLPTEAEWEKAARGETGFNHPWGNGRAIWKKDRAPKQITKVGSYPLDRSPFGVLDMAGNAREWVLDLYSESTHEDAASLTPDRSKNWAGPEESAVPDNRVVKGSDPNWIMWHRTSIDMRSRAPDVGFRCVLRVPLNPSK